MSKSSPESSQESTHWSAMEILRRPDFFFFFDCWIFLHVKEQTQKDEVTAWYQLYLIDAEAHPR